MSGPIKEHGYVAYTHGCRCDTCRAAKATYMRTRRAEARRYATQSNDGRAYVANIPTHGLYGYQTHRCRCQQCIDAKRAADRRQRRARRGGTS